MMIFLIGTFTYEIMKFFFPASVKTSFNSKAGKLFIDCNFTMKKSISLRKGSPCLILLKPFELAHIDVELNEDKSNEI